ncbi:helix-turn-helix domain-containing protein [Halovivax sp.]|uniref:helix-turn-helix domain-containing protein n=1 Tax=Halovivax sp. TaxID=1935978 RepID=UPI0025BA1C44|nr:helix-turn-helix domain-containing protein [Halovivax sp.]
MKKRVDLRLWHDGCWMLELTREFPGAELVVTDICSDGTDILATVSLLGSEAVDLEDVEEAAAGSGAVRSLDVLEGHADQLRVHVRYDAAASIYEAIVQSSLTPVGEIRITDDREQWTLLADGASIGSSMAELEAVADVDVRRVIDYEPEEAVAGDLVDEIAGELSQRQTRYLLSAFEEGYYGWPREVSAKELAAKHDVSGPTALEHLRKGEATVLQQILEVVERRERRQADSV